ncbi:MAG: GNAT family N-acetyltransferase [Lachnospiraceae bacterium]|nr:GNAT family N-acetyltransferase [Lachnospiraceae bacterium]
MNYEIIKLPEEEWKGTKIPLDYTTEEYYDLEMTQCDDGFAVMMKKKRFDKPVTHLSADYDFPDGLYEDYRPGAEAFGIVFEKDGKKELMACIEIWVEDWSNRLIVTELWVHDSLHRQGIGTALMNIAKQKAKEQGRRAIMLETQSCNVRALAFYRAMGFQMIGFDTCCYTNHDIERQEVRINMGFFMD